MTSRLPPDPDQQQVSQGGLRAVGVAAVGLGLTALAAAAFVLSYPGIHAFALQAGISSRLAPGYPLLADAMLVVVIAAVLSLRGAGLPSRLLAWLMLLVLLIAAATADALHADGHRIAGRPYLVTAAVLPWALVLIALALLLAILRHIRLRPRAAGHRADAGEARHRPAPPPLPKRRPQPQAVQRDDAESIIPGLASLPARDAEAHEPLRQATPAQHPPWPDLAWQPGISSGVASPSAVQAPASQQAAADDQAMDESAIAPEPPGPTPGTAGNLPEVVSAAPTPDETGDDMPVFDRVRNSAVPPTDQEDEPGGVPAESEEPGY